MHVCDIINQNHPPHSCLVFTKQDLTGPFSKPSCLAKANIPQG